MPLQQFNQSGERTPDDQQRQKNAEDSGKNGVAGLFFHPGCHGIFLTMFYDFLVPGSVASIASAGEGCQGGKACPPVPGIHEYCRYPLLRIH